MGAGRDADRRRLRRGQSKLAALRAMSSRNGRRGAAASLSGSPFLAFGVALQGTLTSVRRDGTADWAGCWRPLCGYRIGEKASSIGDGAQQRAPASIVIFIFSFFVDSWFGGFRGGVCCPREGGGGCLSFPGSVDCEGGGTRAERPCAEQPSFLRSLRLAALLRAPLDFATVHWGRGVEMSPGDAAPTWTAAMTWKNWLIGGASLID